MVTDSTATFAGLKILVSAFNPVPWPNFPSILNRSSSMFRSNFRLRRHALWAVNVLLGASFPEIEFPKVALSRLSTSLKKHPPDERNHGLAQFLRIEPNSTLYYGAQR